MSIEDKFGWIGRCKEDNHDKIWGYFYRPTPPDQYYRNCCVFWARRGKAMRFKADTATYDLTDRLVQSKRRKGYISINQSHLFEIWPTFIEEAEAKLMWDVLAGKVK